MASSPSPFDSYNRFDDVLLSGKKQDSAADQQQQQSQSSGALTSPSLSRKQLFKSDLQEARLVEKQNWNAVQFALHQVDSLLDNANGALEDMSDNPEILGSAIIRATRDLADLFGNLANQIDGQSDDERRLLAEACIEDAHTAVSGSGGGGGMIPRRGQRQQQSQSAFAPTTTASHELVQMSPDQVMTAIGAAAGLLREVELTLRQIEQDEADEIADAAVTVAHLFLTSIQSITSNLSPDDFMTTKTNITKKQQQQHHRRRATAAGEIKIEILDENGNRLSSEGDDGDLEHGNYDGYDDDDDDDGDDDGQAKKKQQTKTDRMRCLWPPIGNSVVKVLQWGHDMALQKPTLAVALGMVLWPVAVIGAGLCAPVIVGDYCLQELYNHFQDTILVEGLERTAAQLYQTGRLGALCAKLVGRQTMRVVNRQMKRHGGVHQIVQNLGGFAVDCVKKPTESIGVALGGVMWAAERAQHIYATVKAIQEGTQMAVMNLQQ